MKHPALARVLAAVLAVVSVLTILSGAVGVGKAVKDNKENIRKSDVLSGKILNASLLGRRLKEDAEVFNSADSKLPADRERYGDDISEYRKELATHTATKAGLVLGRGALGSAAAAMKDGWDKYNEGYAAYEQGAAAFEEGYQQYLAAKEGLEMGWAAYNEGMAQLEANSELIAQQKQQVEMLLKAIEEVKLRIAELKAYIDDMKEQMPIDQALLEEKLKELEELINQLAPQLSQYEKDMLVYNAACALYEEAEKYMAQLVEQGYSEKEVKAKADEICMESFDMTFEELKVWLETNKPVLDDENQEIQDSQIKIELTQEQYEALLKLINENEGLMEGAEEALAAAEAELEKLEEQLRAALEAMEEPVRQLEQLRMQLEEGQKQLEAGEPAILEGKAQMDAAKKGMEAARAALEEGQKQIDSGWAQMAAKEKELDEQAEELKAEKARLEEAYDSIDAMELTVEDYETLEDSYSSARAALMSYDGIARKVNEGGELINSAETELELMRRNAGNEFRNRMILCVLMMLCGSFGVLSMLGAFEKLRIRRLWILVSAAAVIAAASEIWSIAIGRGMLYTSVFVLIFGAALIPLTVSRQKQT